MPGASLKPSRIIRDATVLVLFCGSFYLLTLFVARLDGDDDANRSDFSRTRIRAEEKLDRRDWRAAASEYQELVEADPYNGQAHYTLANCSFYLSFEKSDEIANLKKTSPEDEAELQRLNEELDELYSESQKLFLKAKEFARFRVNSLLRMAFVESLQGKYEDALGHLKEFVELGGRTSRGLDDYIEFGRGGDEMTTPGAISNASTRLHDRPEFWAIVRKEARNKSGKR